MAVHRQNRRIGENHVPLRDQVRDELRAQIQDGRLAPAKRLVEQTLADEFGVSRIPVREALRSLESEGLVVTVPRRGVFVVELTRSDLVHLYDVRAALEPLAFDLAAQHHTEDELDALRVALAGARAAVEADDHTEAVRLNATFHDIVTSIGRNPFLGRALEPLTGRLGWVIGHGYEYERDLSEHASLLDAIASQDSGLARKRARSHIRASRAHALREYDKPRAQDAGADELEA